MYNPPPALAESLAQVAKLVDAPDLGSGAERRGGSSPFLGTIGFQWVVQLWIISTILIVFRKSLDRLCLGAIALSCITLRHRRLFMAEQAQRSGQIGRCPHVGGGLDALDGSRLRSIAAAGCPGLRFRSFVGGVR